MLEVEIKAKVNKEVIQKRLLMAGANFVREEQQRDTYYNHPCVDFKLKDEALRVRQVEDRLYLTFKGPKLDSETKTRNEIQVELQGKIFSLLEALDFSPLRQVVKKRALFYLEGLKIFVDEVEKLGSFLEIEAESVEEKDKMFRLIDKLGIENSTLTKKSYLELIMDKQTEDE